MRRVLLLAFFLAQWCDASAQQSDYSALVRRSSQNEKQALQSRQCFEFVERTQLEWGSETRAVVETREGRVDRVIAYHDQPLGAEQEKKEWQRLTKLLNNPSALRDEVADQREEDRRRELMVTTLPDALLVEFAGTEANGQLRFTFRPDPGFSPKTRETQVFKGMRGLLWIDPRAERIVHIQGELFKDVSFGWGILGRLHKGGRFEVIQSQVRPGIWRITTLNLDFSGRILLFKPLRIFRRENSNQFVPTAQSMPVSQALTKLLSRSDSEKGLDRNSNPSSAVKHVSVSMFELCWQELLRD